MRWPSSFQILSLSIGLLPFFAFYATATMRPSARYVQLLKELYRVNMNNPVKMGLQNTLRLNELLGDPLKGIAVVHVAGTNGKGSVSLKTAEVLRLSGLRTGLFVSPHISSFRERIQVDGTIMSEADVETMLPELLALCSKHDIPATFFELTTLLSFMRFGRAKCDAVVLEVGLGGRLDSTNIVAPALSVITSIQLDHTKILGDTIEAIAKEKAGIMKKGVPVLVAPGCPQDVMRAEAERAGAQFNTLSSTLSPDQLTYGRAKTDKHTGQQVEVDIDDLNVDITRAALVLLQRQGGAFSSLLSPSNEANVEAGLASRPPCRFQLVPQHYEGVDVILDIAHNEDAVKALVSKIRAQYPASPVRVVLGMSADKDVRSCIKSIVGLFPADGRAASRIHCTAASHPRALPAADLAALVADSAASASASASALGPVPMAAGVAEALNEALRLCSQEAAALASSKAKAQARAVVVVCGTAFIMADARAALGVVEPRDGDFLSPGQKDAQENFSSKA